MQLVTLAHRPGAGIVLGDEILDLAGCRAAVRGAGLIPTSVRGILEGGSDALDLVRRVADDVTAGSALAERLRETGALLARDSVRLLAPIPNPGMILGCGLNYHAHLEELKVPVPAEPTSFTKNAAQVIGPGEPIVLPRSNPAMVDWEGEFTIVIGTPCENVEEKDALDYVAGYTLINDVSARDWVAPVFSATGVMGPILAWEQNLLGKQFPTFCPMGPTLVTIDEIPDPENVAFSTLLNGEVMQSANTSDLVFSVRRLIAYYSRFYRFAPGDLITTGSPSGVGYGREPKVFMQEGDRIEVRASAIGVLANPVRRA